MPALPLLVALALALATSGVIAGLTVWAGPVDRPRARGAHDRPVATSGGVAIMAGTSVGLLALALWTGRTAHSAFLALAFAGAMGLLGAVDDLVDLGARTKLFLQTAAAFGFAIFVARVESLPLTTHMSLALGPVLGVVGTALWLVVAANATNFMDGADGLAAGALAIAGFAFATAGFAAGAPDLGAVALIGAAGAIGFLPWNLSGRLFQGDAGALFSSVLLASLAAIGASSSGGVVGPVPVWVAPLALLPLLTDVLLTLLHRARRRQPLLSPHREHLYQLWLTRTGKPHTALAWRTYLIIAGFGAAATGSVALSAAGRLALFVAATALSAGLWAVLRRRL